MITNQSELQTNKRPNKVITLQEKLDILKQLETGSSRREVEEIFKCSQSTISRVLLSKETILQGAQENFQCKREGMVTYRELEHALSKWAQKMKASNTMITANMAKLKAEEISRAMGHVLKPSTAWLYKWKERENIKFAKRTKDPEEILRELLDKREKSKEIQQHYEENTKRKKTKNDESRTIFEEDIGRDVEESSNKPRTKREYIKRLPIIDASGLICRSRKEKTFLTLLQKLEILQRLKNGERRPDLIIEYKLSQSAMSQIVSDEKKILNLAAVGQNLQMKRIRGGIFKVGEAELNAWVQEKMKNGESLTRTQIKNKAKEIADRLQIDFKASTGWLEKWKARMNLDFNENQILQRKIPNYLSNEDESINELDNFNEPKIVCGHVDNCDYSEALIKQEILENDCHAEQEIRDEYSYDDIDEAEIKPDLLTPQQFYLQTIQADKQTARVQHEKEEQKKIDIKPIVGTTTDIPHVPQHEETLHEQVLSWLNRYNISPEAATDLLNILQPHLDLTVKIKNSAMSTTKIHQYF